MDTYRSSPSLRRSVYRLALYSLLLLAALSIALSRIAGVGVGGAVILWTAPVIALYTVFVLMNLALLRGPDDRPAGGVQFANVLTALRLFLVPPMLVLLFGGEILLGSVLYAVAACTDVADGLIARRLGQETLLGVVLDPVGDIVSTAAVCLYLWREGAVPTWLIAVLAVRYAQFFVGLGLLAVLGALPRFGATAAGKIVGVVQAVGITLILAGRIFPASPLLGTIREYTIAVLGFAFGAVIASQTAIGWRALRAREGRRASQQGVP